MWLKFQSERDRSRFLVRFEKLSPQSRFIVGTRSVAPNFKLYLGSIRLWRKKDYCGQHPGPCLPSPLGERPHKRGSWLEGSDWVGFNDLLNDICDKLNLTVDIWSHNREAHSGKYWIRQGARRRTGYLHEWTWGVRHWAKEQDSDFEDCRGQVSLVSNVSDGTPGIPHWRRSMEKRRKFAVLFD